MLDHTGLDRSQKYTNQKTRKEHGKPQGQGIHRVRVAKGRDTTKDRRRTRTIYTHEIITEIRHTREHS